MLGSRPFRAGRGTAAGEPSARPQAWILTDGLPGHLNQCLGLADALGISPEVKLLAPRPPWSRLPPRLWLRPLGRGAVGAGAGLAPPWPGLLIAAGRRTVAPAAAIKRAAGPATFAVQIQNPGSFTSTFDIVAAPRHDRAKGFNVFPITGALTRVSPELLGREKARMAGLFAPLPRPIVGVLVGGSNRVFRLTRAAAEALLEDLGRLCRETGAGLAVTTSRRTAPEIRALLRAGVGRLPALFWDAEADCPYYALLAWSDAIVVTADSVSMISEACGTGAPVYLAPLEGGSRKFRAFHRLLERDGRALPFAGALDGEPCRPLDDTARVADEVRRRCGAV